MVGACWDLHGKLQSRTDIPSKLTIPGLKAELFLDDPALIARVTPFMESREPLRCVHFAARHTCFKA